MVYMYYSFIIHPSTKAYLVCFHMNKAAIDMAEQVSEIGYQVYMGHMTNLFVAFESSPQ